MTRTITRLFLNGQWDTLRNAILSVCNPDDVYWYDYFYPADKPIITKEEMMRWMYYNKFKMRPGLTIAENYQLARAWEIGRD